MAPFGSKPVSVIHNDKRYHLGEKQLYSFDFEDLEVEIRIQFEKDISIEDDLNFSYLGDGIRRRIAGDTDLRNAMRSSDSTLTIFIDVRKEHNYKQLYSLLLNQSISEAGFPLESEQNYASTLDDLQQKSIELLQMLEEKMQKSMGM